MEPSCAQSPLHPAKPFVTVTTLSRSDLLFCRHADTKLGFNLVLGEGRNKALIFVATQVLMAVLMGMYSYSLEAATCSSCF